MLIASALLCMLCDGTTGFATTQQPSEPQGISSSEFLNHIDLESLTARAALHSFPSGILTSQRPKLEPDSVTASFDQELARPEQQPVKTAQFESSSQRTLPIGSGVVQPVSTLPLEPGPITNKPIADTSMSQRFGEWRSKLELDPNLPDFLFGYEAISIQRSNDSIGPYSMGQEMDRFARENSGRITVSRLLGGIERIEFKFTGPLHWGRHSTSIGPIDSLLPLSLAPQFDNATVHQQSHQVRLTSYELNRCNTGDELSQFFYGVRFFDHGEQFQLDSVSNASTSRFQLETSNILAGWQIGLQLNRPLSQRLTIGIGTGGGLYGNFANGTLQATSGNSTLADLKDRKLRLTTMWESVAMINYRITQNILLSGGYEGWYFSALTTAADQRPESSAQGAAFSLRTRDDQLFRGWTVGLSARF